MLLVVVADACNDAQVWIADIGAIQATAESDLDDVDLGFAISEGQPSHGGSHFEEGWRAVLALGAILFGRADLIDDFDKFFRLYGLGVDDEAFFEVD